MIWSFIMIAYQAAICAAIMELFNSDRREGDDDGKIRDKASDKKGF